MKKLLLLSLFILMGCASTKNKQYQSIETKQSIKSIDSVKITSKDTTSIKDTSESVEESFEPIDSTQPMVIDKKNGIYRNTRFKTRKIKNDISISNKQESVANQIKSTLNEKSESIVTKSKDKKVIDTSNFWIILIVILVLIYLQKRLFDKL